MAEIGHNTNKNKRTLNEHESDGPSRKKMKLTEHGSKSTPMSTVETVEALHDIFAKMEQPQRKTIGGTTSFPSTAGLYVEGIGHIPLPICDIHTQQLFALYSKSSNDGDIALEASKFHFSHPKWNENIQQLISSVSISLGIDYEHIHFIEAHLDKLHISKDNACFARSDELDKPADAFATLIVQVPSNYSVVNGDPILTIEDDAFYFGTDDGYAPFNIFHAAFYNDTHATHNVIENGYRTCITYHICWNGPKHNAPTTDKMKHLSEEVDRVLQSWDAKQCIVLPLKHQYDVNELTDFHQLKPIDIKQANVLNKEPFVVYLAQIDAHKDVVSNKWLTVLGHAFEFGRYFDINLNTDCIDYQSHEDGDRVSSVKNRNRWVIVMMKESYQFSIILRNSVNGAIKWIEKVLQTDGNRDILGEMTQIVVKGTCEPSYGGVNVLSMLRILQQKSYYPLFCQVVNTVFISSGKGLHQSNNALSESIATSVADYGWKEPLRSCVLNLMDCLKSGTQHDIHYYCDFIHILVESNCVSFGNAQRRELLMCGYVRSHMTQMQFLSTPDDIIQIIDDIHGQDCCQEIADKISTNVEAKCKTSPGFSARNGLCIYKFLFSYQWNQQKRNEMIRSFNDVYIKVADEQFIKPLVAYLSANKTYKYFNQMVDVLLNAFRSSYAYRPHLIHQILMLLNLDQFIEFVRKKLKFHDCSNTRSYAFGYAYGRQRYGYGRKGSEQQYTKYKVIIKDIGNVIVSHEWNGALKRAILEWIQSLTPVIAGIKTVQLLIKEVKDKMNTNEDEDEDNDIVILNTNPVLVNCDECVKDIQMSVWKTIIESFGTTELSALSIEDTMVIVGFIIRSFDPNDTTQHELYKTFDTMYAKVKQPIQRKVIAQIKSEITSESLVLSKCIQNIFRHRIQYLSDLKEPVFSWKMMQHGIGRYTSGYRPTPPSDTAFETFLKSDKMTFVKKGFRNIAAARRWTPYRNSTVSVTFSAEGRGANAYVLVTKTKTYFNKEILAEYQRSVAELNDLLSFMI
eukprot:641929_1